MSSSLTTALEDMTINNEQLRRENDILKTDNMQLRQLRTEVDMIKAENIQLKTENDDLRRHTGTRKLQPLPRARQKPKVSQ